MSFPTLTDAQLVSELKVVRAHKTIAAAARFLGVNRNQLNEHVSEAKARGLTADTPIRDELAKTKAELVSAKADIRMLQKEHDTAEKIRNRIYKLAERTPEPPAWLNPLKKPKGSRGVPVMIWSDWHYGEVVRPEEVGGVNEFNAEIAAARITKLVDTSIDLAFRPTWAGRPRNTPARSCAWAATC